MACLFIVAALLAPGADGEERKLTPVAPSLPALTREQERKQEEVINRFILADTGRLRGEEARQAVKDFEKLGPEATAALIRGLNQSAKLEHTCPVLMISKKLVRILDATNDPQLLEYARDEIGGGVRNSPHARTLQGLRVGCMLRKNALARMPRVAEAPALRSLPSMKDADLVRAARTARGISLRGILRELSRRDSKEALDALTWAARSAPTVNDRSYARDMLDVQLARMPASSLSEKAGDGPVEVRLSAVRVAAKDARNTAILIDRLTDASPAVRAEARTALRKLSKTEDFGPQVNASKAEQTEAQRRWKEWWANR